MHIKLLAECLFHIIETGQNTNNLPHHFKMPMLYFKKVKPNQIRTKRICTGQMRTDTVRQLFNNLMAEIHCYIFKDRFICILL